MLWGGGLVSLLVLALWVFCIFDVIGTEESLTRNLPKMIWLLIVIFVPPIGPLAWLIMGRPQNAGFSPGDTTTRAPGETFGSRPPRKRPLAPDDDPAFLAEIDERSKKLKEWEEELKRREDELKRREQGEP
jgi:Phospholipase_D-nuclease N-terminal